MLAEIWFCIVAVMIAVYVILDGFDLGAGIVHLGVARNERERRMVLKSIGPVWDGNEVWLLAGGGTLYFAFPALYASSFSGFYLPLMIVLWLLILRGASIEFRGHVDNAIWKPLWDTVFCFSSGLLAIFFGAALGNVVRGVPLDPSGDFFLPLWTNWMPGEQPGILDWYTVLVGVFAFLTLTQHGALWVAHKTEDAVQRRARNIAGYACVGVAVLMVVVTAVSFAIQPHLARSFAAMPAGYIFPTLALSGLAAAFIYRRREEDLKAFLGSAVFILGMLTSVVFGVFPNVLPANNPALSLTIHNAAAPEYGLKVGLVWFTPGFLLAISYSAFLYKRFSGKVQLEEGGHRAARIVLMTKFLALAASGLLSVSVFGQTAAPAVKSAPKAVPAKAVAAKTEAAKPAFDKVKFDAYVRHLLLWGPHINVAIADPIPGPMPGYSEVKVTGSYQQASLDEIFYVSTDGQKIVRGAVYDINQSPFAEQIAKLKTDLQPSKGTPGAPVVLVLFSDFQCGFCKALAKTLHENLLKTYPKEVRLYYKDMPIDQIHPWAKSASIAGRCVNRQDPLAFWDFHDWMFDKQQEINGENLKAKVSEWVQQKGLDTIQFSNCYDNKSTAPEIERNQAEARALRVTSTPTLFINGRQTQGAMSWEEIKAYIDFELDYNKKTGEGGEKCCQLTLPVPGKK